MGRCNWVICLDGIGEKVGKMVKKKESEEIEDILVVEIYINCLVLKI